jgi:hypothetical protein
LGIENFGSCRLERTNYRDAFGFLKLNGYRNVNFAYYYFYARILAMCTKNFRYYQKCSSKNDNYAGCPKE